MYSYNEKTIKVLSSVVLIKNRGGCHSKVDHYLSNIPREAMGPSYMFK